MGKSRHSKTSAHVRTSRSVDPLTVPGTASGVHPGSLPQLVAALGWGGFGSGSGYAMAENSSARGLVYFPELNTRREVTSYTRTAGLRKARYLEANVGLARRILNGMGRMVAGTGLTPNPTTRDKEWNKLTRRRIDALWSSAETYDIAGNFNAYSSQADIVSTRYRDGDCGKVFTRDAAGNLRVAFYEGHQIEPGFLSVADQSNVFDGVRVDRLGRKLSFFIRDGEQTGKSVEIPAALFLHVMKADRLGAPRGITILKHAINNLLDRAELEGFIKHGIKAANKIGFALVKDLQAPPGRISHTNPTRVETVTDSTGATRKVKVEEVTNGGGEIPELPAGWDIKMLLDQRPHPNTRDFFEDLIRDIALGCDWMPELLWNIAKLGGANTRYVMADAQSTIEKEQQWLVDTMLTREYVMFLAAEITAGRLPPCNDPEWWAHEFIPPARITVDYGRDGKLHLEQIKSGALTFRRFFGWQGLAFEEQADQWLDEVKHWVDGCQARFPGDEKMRAFMLQALYQRVGLASTLDAAPTAEEIAAAQADQAAN